MEMKAKVARGRMGVPERDAKWILSMGDLCERYLTEYDSPGFATTTSGLTSFGLCYARC